jgi:hypothetical protein
MCVCYMGIGSNGYFIADIALKDNHYRMDIVSSVGYSRLNFVVLLVFYTITYNIRGTGVVLQVSRDNVNLAENE